MRCVACNVELNDFESTRKNAETGEYLDMCDLCFRGVKHSIPVIERHDLQLEADTQEDEFEEYTYDELSSETDTVPSVCETRKR